MRAGEQAHRFAEGEAVLRRGRLHGSELVEHPAESVAIDFDPASAHQVQAVRRGEQLLDLRRGQRFAVEADAHLEVEQRVRAETRRRLAPDGGGDLRTWRTIRPPGARHAHDDARGLEAGHIGQQLKRLGGRPAQRVIDLARVDHRLQPRALGGGALDRQEQREQPRLVGGAGVFAQRAAERQVLRLGVRRQLRRVGRQKRERRVIVPAVLGEVEMDAADEMPRRVLALEKRLDRRLRFGELGSKRRGDLSPERFENARPSGTRRRSSAARPRRAPRARSSAGAGMGAWCAVEIGMRADGS